MKRALRTTERAPQPSNDNAWLAETAVEFVSVPKVRIPANVITWIGAS